MLFHIVIFILNRLVYIAEASAGSTLFRNIRISCWDEREIIQLQARKLFEDVLPQTIDPYNINDKFIKDLTRYFRKTLNSANTINDPLMLKDVMADTLGAHLRYEILPAARLAFYSGHITHKNVRRIHELYEEIKESLNTQGLGWQQPRRTQQWQNLTVSKITITSGRGIFNPCSNLVIRRDVNSCFHFPKPRLDDSINPSALALPFKNGGLVSLTAPSSKNIVLKYYVAATKCVLNDSPNSCKESDLSSLNLDLWNWLKRDVSRHIQDEKLYTAFGGVLQVAASVQANRLDKARRNLFNDAYNSVQNISPRWTEMVHTLNDKDYCWTSMMYILAVIAIALSLFLFQLILKVFCSSSGPKNSGSSIISFMDKQTRDPPQAMPVTTVPNIVNYSEQLNSWTKSTSLGSMQTQKVYDLNENTEKLMIVSRNEHSESSLDSEEEGKKRSNSPPKLETSISEVKIDQKKRSCYGSSSRGTGETYEINSKLDIYSTQNNTEQLDGNSSDSLWTVPARQSVSSSSESSSTSTHDSTRRPLALKKRIAGSIKFVEHSQFTSNTDINFNTYTTASEDINN